MERFFARSLEQIVNLLSSLEQEPRVGWDIETSSLEPDSIVAGFSIHVPTSQMSFYVPFHHPEHVLSYETQLTIAKLVAKLKVVTYNGQSDAGKWYHLYGCYPQIVGDAMILGKMLQGASKYTFGLKPTALELGTLFAHISIEDVLGQGNFDFTKATLSNPLTLSYTCQDAEQALLVEAALMQRDLKREKYPSFDYVYRLELDILPIVGREELRGLAINMEKFTIAAKNMEMEADELSQEIIQELGRDPLEFNLDSDQSLSAALFNSPDRIPAPLPPKKPRQRKEFKHDQRDLPGIGLKPGTPGTPKGPIDLDTGKPRYWYHSTAVLELQRIEDQHPIIRKIIDYKHLASISKDIQNVNEFVKNGRLHTQFLTIGDDGTSRIYCKDPNVIGMSKTVRAAMPPDEGCIYFHVDYKAAEWRLVGLLAGENRILGALDNGVDPHIQTYSLMSKTPVDQVTKSEREKGKILNYAALYGSTGYSLARSLKCSEQQANEEQKKFWEEYPDLRRWRDERYSYAEKHAKTETVIGRIRKLPEMFTGNAQSKAMAKRRSVNTSAQGSCGDLLKMAYREFYRLTNQPDHFLGKYQARCVMPVYDAALVSMKLPEQGVNSEYLAAAMVALKQAFELKLSYKDHSTTFKVDIHYSTEDWLTAMSK